MELVESRRAEGRRWNEIELGIVLAATDAGKLKVNRTQPRLLFPLGQ